MFHVLLISSTRIADADALARTERILYGRPMRMASLPAMRQGQARLFARVVSLRRRRRMKTRAGILNMGLFRRP